MMIKKRYPVQPTTMSIFYAVLMVKSVTSFKGRFHERSLYTAIDGNFETRENNNVSDLSNSMDQV